MRASEERAALNFLADANGFSGVEEREDSDALEIEMRLEENNEVGFKRRFGACVSVEAMVSEEEELSEWLSVVPSESGSHSGWHPRSGALAIFNRENILHRD